MKGRTGGQVNERTGRVETGHMPKGHCDPYGGAQTFTDGPLRIFRRKR